jgi:hypothetical protein
MRTLGCSALLLLASASSTAGAQVCEGSPSYRTHPVSVGTGVSRTGHWTSMGASVGGGLQGAYASIGAGYDRRDASYPTTPGLSIHDRYIGAHVGYEHALGRDNGTILCPILGGSRAEGPNYDARRVPNSTGPLHHVATRDHQVWYGAALGTVMRRNTRIRVLPSAQFVHVASRTRIVVDNVPTDDNLDYSNIQFSLGINFTRAFTVEPWGSLVTLENAAPSIGVDLRWSFGGRGRP